MAAPSLLVVVGWLPLLPWFFCSLYCCCSLELVYKSIEKDKHKFSDKNRYKAYADWVHNPDKDYPKVKSLNTRPKSVPLDRHTIFSNKKEVCYDVASDKGP